MFCTEGLGWIHTSIWVSSQFQLPHHRPCRPEDPTMPMPLKWPESCPAAWLLPAAPCLPTFPRAAPAPQAPLPNPPCRPLLALGMAQAAHRLGLSVPLPQGLQGLLAAGQLPRGSGSLLSAAVTAHGGQATAVPAKNPTVSPVHVHWHSSDARGRGGDSGRGPGQWVPEPTLPS